MAGETALQKALKGSVHLAYQKEDWIQLDYYVYVSTFLGLGEEEVPNCKGLFNPVSYICKQIVENWSRHINTLQIILQQMPNW